MRNPSPDALRRWLLDTVAEHTGARIEADRPLGDHGLSSRQAVGIAADLEDLLGTRLPSTLLWESPTIDHLVRTLTGGDEPGVAPSTDRRRTDPIAVVGLGCRWPGADGLDEYWDLLWSGRDAVRTAPPGRWSPDAAPVVGGFLDDVAGFDAEHFGITPREAATMDPQQRMLLEVTWAALEHAGIAPASLRGSRTGVFTGIATHDYGHLTMGGDGVDLWTATGAAGSIAANRLSYVYDLRGPSMAVDTACSSSLVAVHHAVRALRDGEADLALAAGVNLMLLPGPTAAFAAAGLLAGDGRCKTFAAAADGIARAEGCGVVVLKRLADAEVDGDRVLAVIRSSAVNSDGRSNGLAAPNPVAQQAMLHDAYRAAGLDPSTVDYVEAHGTGTLLGDPIEARSLGAVLGAGRASSRPLLIGSVKTNIAHAEAAAGIAGLIKVVLAITHDELPPQLHFDAPNPHIPFDELRLRVVTEATPWPRHAGRATAGVSAFGFGGTNAHVVLEEAAPVPPTPSGGVRIALVSARSRDRLTERTEQLARWLETSSASLADVTHTLFRRDNGARHRAAFVAGDTAELASLLRAVETDPLPAGAAIGTARDSDGPVFVFSGHGSQWPGMGRGLLDVEPAFTAQVDKLGDRFTEHTGQSLRALLTTSDPLPLPQTQAAIFGTQVALAAQWEALGVRPAAVIGHSLGSAAAAVVSGALDVDEAVHLVATRARLLGAVPAGGMAAVELSPEELAAYPGVELAVDSAPRQLTVAGSAAVLDRLVAELSSAGRTARRLPVEVAGHSAAVVPVVDALREALVELGGRRPSVPWYDTVLADPRELPDFDAGYWAAHLRRPVRFRQAVTAAAEDGHRTFVEIAPHPILRGSVARTLAAAGITDAVVTGTLRRGQDEVRAFGAAAAALYCAGTRITPGDSYDGARLADVPTMRWRHERHWFTSTAGGPAELNHGFGSGSGAVAAVPPLVPPGAVAREETSSVAAPGPPGPAARTESAAAEPPPGPLGPTPRAGSAGLPPSPLDPVHRTESAGDPRPGSLGPVPRTGSAAAEPQPDLLDPMPRAGSASVTADRPPVPLGPAPRAESASVTADSPPVPLGPTPQAETSTVAAPDPLQPPTHTGSAATPGPLGPAPRAESANATADPPPIPLSPAPSGEGGRLTEIVAAVMGLRPDRLDADVPLVELGLDSLMANRIRETVRRELGAEPDAAAVLRGATLADLNRDLALRAGESPRPARGRAWDAADRLVLRLWTEHTGSEPGGTHVRLSGTGRPEALAALLADGLTAELDTPVRVADLLRHDSLAAIADVARAVLDTREERGPVHVLKSGDAKPLLLFHPGGSTCTVYRPLLDRLPGTVPCLGFERVPGASVEERVERLLPLVRATRPPYRLAGWSFGGALAYGVAAKLAEEGLDVELVALIDTMLPLPEPDLDPRASSARRFVRFTGYVEGTYGRAVRLGHDELAPLPEEEQIELTMRRVAEAGLLSPGVLRHQRQSFLDTLAAERAVPPRYDGRVVLYRATEPYAAGLAMEPRYSRTDLAAGWAELAPNLEIVPVAAHHLSVVDPPHVDVVARHLAGLLCP
ncbi:beta-ketoacyl synthase N-terminal-like domain-containing protein [Amycolatopsis sp., V23-08]|uniref:Beta-ketoacyl synthase N-terminal-like domain-containing protein n=1 Tax=Amycolatopsis heterodermiae TaxID=3110235 RepID=A0ABU5RN18_9PSEU|nr:polyketide synthase [Amycolatopsis sp., V23-08]MEA5367079.1 beta-ketoacyl synthase N-terminal-like domain-containing protein [Amycolatopsis sp., V23-08]